jgi:hypothetical protein
MIGTGEYSLLISLAERQEFPRDPYGVSAHHGSVVVGIPKGNCG